MFLLDLQDSIDRIPDSFRDGKKPTGNIYRIYSVWINELNKDMADLQAIFDALDLANQFGLSLDLTGISFDLFRRGRTDDEFRAEIFAFKNGNFTGNDINSIIRLFQLLTGAGGLNVRIKEKFDDDLTNPRPRAFDIILDTIDTSDLTPFLNVAKRIKAGGIDVTVDELSTNSFLLQLNGDKILQLNGDKIIIEPGNI